MDSELFIIQTKAHELHQLFQDGRSTVAKRYHEAQQRTKPEKVRTMIHRSLRVDIEADYLLADAWFGTKPMIHMCQQTVAGFSCGNYWCHR